MEKNQIALAIAVVFILTIGFYFMFAEKEETIDQIESAPKQPEIEQPQAIEKPVEKEEPRIIEPKNYKISISYNLFDPKELVIEKGSTVTWTNKGNKNHKIYHNAPNKEFYSEIIAPGDSFSHTFDKVGEYNYADVMFKYINGKVIVEEGSTFLAGHAIGLFKNPKAVLTPLICFLMVFIAFTIIIYKRKHIIRKFDVK